MNGVLIVDKPGGMTSHDVVNRVRRIVGQRAVGHLGTLDPSATGILPLVLGNLTRLAQFYTSSEKDYEGVIRFGFSTDTYDAEGDPTSPAVTVKVSLDEIRARLGHFRGEIQQLPPPFSAKKIQGVPAYKLARKHKEVPLKPVTVNVKSLEVIALDGDRAYFTASVASGTYMRSIAHDLGQEMGCGAHLESLRRTRVAEFGLADSHSFEELEHSARLETMEEVLVHPRRLLPELPSVTANEESAAKIRNGRAVNLPELSKAKLVKVFYGQRELICIATRVAGTLFQPRIVLAEPAPQLLYRG
ncbi:MAG TPA: tRNA pseudouridine(55) synthase TruB [Terriglobales bacterium]|nr:tRNA pseudouridine(55) synthase TruB [Terriglobales bacterium]